MRRRSAPFWISACIHFAVIGGAAAFLVKPPEFAMDQGHNSVEVNLVAAEPDPVTPTPPVPQPEEPVVTQPPKPDDFVVPTTPPVPPPPPIPLPPEQIQKPLPPPPVPVVRKSHHIPTVARGDGSAPKPGKDATTASSDGGAIMEARPDYLSNPPPLYPDASRRSKQEGVVVLSVVVSEEGRPDTVAVQTTSGFDPLDQSAVTAVRKWRFRPATLGSMKVKSRVTIPVRFRLGD